VFPNPARRCPIGCGAKAGLQLKTRGGSNVPAAMSEIFAPAPSQAREKMMQVKSGPLQGHL
jgi:hypothetical protein